MAIPDNAGAVTASITDFSFIGPITDVNFRFDGTACSSAVGSTTVGLDHSWVGDLVVTLTSPMGTVVNLMARPGSGSFGASGNNFCQTVLDDEASAPIEGITSAQEPFTGSFTPDAPLAAFDGEDANGIWTLSVDDDAGGDVGSIRAFSLDISTTDLAAVKAEKTVSGDFTEGGTVTYTITSTNEGNTTAPDAPGDELTDVLPPGLTLVSATATSGTAVATVATNTVTWNGTIPPFGGTVTVTITATVNAGTGGTTIANQASISYDSDVDGFNNASAASDDPGTAAVDDPTSFTAVAPAVVTTTTTSTTVPGATTTTTAAVGAGALAATTTTTGAVAAGALARTGASSSSDIGLGLLLVAGGIALVVAGRRRAVPQPGSHVPR